MLKPASPSATSWSEPAQGCGPAKPAWREAKSLLRRRRRLLQAAGTFDHQAFRRRAELQADAARLRAERTQLAQDIDAALADAATEERLTPWLSGRENLDVAETQAAEARQDVGRRLNEALTRRGEMNQQLRAMVEDRQLAYKRIELGIVEKRLTDALDRWRVLAVCGMMLEAVRAYYEREHQPQVLREASGYLTRLTGGRYARVWTPIAEHVLRVDDAEGRSLPVEKLSRGTREQLFLALRLALASSFARRGIQLPLVLDDVLVNFDVTRAKAAAGVLRDFAREGHQVLLFTCHEHIARLFKQLKAEVRQLPDNGEPQTVVAEQPARRPRRPRHEVAAEAEPEPIQEPEEVEAEVASPPPVPLPPPAPLLPPAPVIVAPRPPVIIAPPAPVVLPPAPAAVGPPAPLPPTPTPPPRRPAPRKRVEMVTEQIPWSAEEFEGELADRVRRRRVVEEGEPPATGDDDAEAA